MVYKLKFKARKGAGSPVRSSSTTFKTLAEAKRFATFLRTKGTVTITKVKKR